MKPSDTVKNVAALFGVAPSALRYWDEAGLIRFERDNANNYRVPTFQTLMDIGDVLFLRNLSLPVKDIRRLAAMDTGALERLLRENEAVLQEKIEAMRTSIEKLRQRQETLKRLLALKQAPLNVKMAALPPIEPFSFHDAALVRGYIADPSLAVILVKEGVAEPVFGMVGRGLLRPADQAPGRYLQGLLRSVSDAPEQNDAARFFAKGRELGLAPGRVIGTYLLSACEEGTRYDYYEAWMELG